MESEQFRRVSFRLITTAPLLGVIVGPSELRLWSAKYSESDIPKITTSITNANSGAQIAYAAPQAPQPWVATMNPYVQGADPDDLRVTSTLTFSNTDIYDAFYDEWGGNPRLTFDPDDHIVTVDF